MGLFDFFSPPSSPAQENKSLPLGSGRRLRSGLTLNDNLIILESLLGSYRTPKYENLPHYVYPGWTWHGSDVPPKTVILFDDNNGDFLLCTFWSNSNSTEFGLFPLGNGDDRLSALPIIGHWKQKDTSLTSIGVVPERAIRLVAPKIPDNFFVEILNKAGFPPTPGNVDAVGRKIGEMFLIKAYEFISSQDPHYHDRFIQNHRYTDGSLTEFCQSILNDLVEWNPGVLPYIQDLPMRARAILLEIRNIEDDGFWSKLER